VTGVQDFYYENEYIIREGATGDTFFIINKGEVTSISRPSLYLIIHFDAVLIVQ